MSIQISDDNEIVELLTRIAVAVESLAGKKSTRPKRDQSIIDQERAAQAYIAVANGCNTITAIAEFIGIGRTVASKNPGIQRALAAAKVDRTAGEAGEDYQWHQ